MKVLRNSTHSHLIKLEKIKGKNKNTFSLKKSTDDGERTF